MAFTSAFMAVFLLVFLASAVVTFTMPETYRACARVAAPEENQLQLIQSPEFLKKVSEQLKLPEALGARYGQNTPLEDKRVEGLLRRSVEVRRVQGTGILEVRVYGRSPAECAEWANEIAQTAARETRQSSVPIKIVEEAMAPLTPSRPNKPLNLALGAAAGFLLGIMSGGVCARLAVISLQHGGSSGAKS